MVPRIFVSSTARDTTEYRDAVLGVIDRADLEPVAMEDWPTPHIGPVRSSMWMLEEGSDHYFGLLGYYRGTEEPSNGETLSTTEQEYRRAFAKYEESRQRMAVYTPLGASKAQHDLLERARRIELKSGASKAEVERRLARQRTFLANVQDRGNVNFFMDNRSLVRKTFDQVEIWKLGGSWITTSPAAENTTPVVTSGSFQTVGLKQQLLAFDAIGLADPYFFVVVHGPPQHGQERFVQAMLDRLRTLGGVDVRQLGFAVTQCEVDTVIQTLGDDSLRSVDEFSDWLIGRLAEHPVVLTIERAQRYRRNGVPVGVRGLAEDLLAPVLDRLSTAARPPDFDLRVLISSELPVGDLGLSNALSDRVHVLPELGPVTSDELFGVLPAAMSRGDRNVFTEAVLAETTASDRVLVELQRSLDHGPT